MFWLYLLAVGSLISVMVVIFSQDQLRLSLMLVILLYVIEFVANPLLDHFSLVPLSHARFIAVDYSQVAVPIVYATASFLLAYVIVQFSSLGKFTYSTSHTENWNPIRAHTYSWILVIGGAVSIVAYMIVWGGVQDYLTNYLIYRREAIDSPFAILKWFAQVSIVGCAFSLVNLFGFENSKYKITIIVQLAITVFIFLVLGGRADLLISLLFLLAIAYYIGADISVVKLSGLGVCVFFFLAYFKGLSILVPRGDFGAVRDFINSRTQEMYAYVINDFYQISVLQGVVDKIGQEGIRYGRSIYEGIINIVPTSVVPLVPSHPSFGAQFRDYLGWDIPPTPPGLMPHLIWDGGYVFLIVGMFLFGIYCSVLDKNLRKADTLFVALPLLVVTLFFTFDTFRHAEYSRIFIKTVTKLIPMIIGMYWVTGKLTFSLRGKSLKRV